MRRARIALSVSAMSAACAIVAPSRARADETTVVEPPQAAAPARAAGTVHASSHAFKGRSARIYVEAGAGHWATVCAAPCEADLPPGAHLRVIYDDVEDEPHDLTLAGGAGSRTDVDIRPASKAALAGGVVMISIGGASALVGLLLTAIGSSPNLSSGEKSTVSTVGIVCTLMGAGLAIGGILLVVNRSHEPRVQQDPSVRYYRGDRGRESRVDDAPPRARAETRADTGALPRPLDLGLTVAF